MLNPENEDVVVCHDIVVVGGGFSGAATALLLKRRCPERRVIVIERSVHFDRKVGESTTEISSCFMVRMLGIGTYLANEHLPKQGLRFWFDRTGEESFDTCGEIGPKFQVRLPAFQIDREKIDSHLLTLAEEAGCEVWRPAKLVDFSYGSAGVSLTVERDGTKETLSAAWLVDASGRAAVSARKSGNFELATEHPTSALWARFTGVTDIDGDAMRNAHPACVQASGALRGLATNHLAGRGWWCWIIPLRGGDTSVGLVYDQRLFDPERLSGANLGEKLVNHLLTHPVGRLLFKNAKPMPGDVKAYSNLAFRSKRIAAPGCIQVGDASGFMDPLYSSGLDYAAFGISHTVNLIRNHPTPATATTDLEKMNDGFRVSFEMWLEAIYKDKYHYIGDADLMSAAMLMDVGCFFIGPVRSLYIDHEAGFLDFPYSGVIGGAVGKFMKLYNRRLAAIAQRRHALGHYGLHNLNRRELYPGFGPGASALPLLFRGIRKWIRAEWDTFWMRPARHPEPAAEIPVSRPTTVS